MIRADLHMHTCYSGDCCTALPQIVDRCLEMGVNCLAVSDHNTIAGALKLRALAPFRVIVAEEVRTSAGELLAFFLSEEIPKGLPPEETISMIKRQGGLVGIPHPFGYWPLRNSNTLLSPRILSQIDIVEVFNARTPLARSLDKAQRLAARYGKAASAGSDAHTAAEIGRAYVEMAEFAGPADFLECLSQGRISGHRSSPLVHLASTWAKVRKCRC